MRRPRPTAARRTAAVAVVVGFMSICASPEGWAGASAFVPRSLSPSTASPPEIKMCSPRRIHPLVTCGLFSTPGGGGAEDASIGVGGDASPPDGDGSSAPKRGRLGRVLGGFRSRGGRDVVEPVASSAAEIGDRGDANGDRDVDGFGDEEMALGKDWGGGGDLPPAAPGAARDEEETGGIGGVLRPPNFTPPNLQPPNVPDLGEVGRSLAERAVSPLEFLKGGSNGAENGRDNEEIAPIGAAVQQRGFSLPAPPKLGVPAPPELPSPPDLGRMGKSLVDQATAPINKLTGKESYEFGDLTRYLDRRARYLDKRARVKLTRSLTSWKFDRPDMFDLSRLVDDRIGDAARTYAGRASDVGRELVRKVAAEEYTLADVTLLCKILIKLGADFSPVAAFLPFSLLLEIFDYSIALDLGDRFIKAVSKEIDSRINEREEEQSASADAGAAGTALPPSNYGAGQGGEYRAGDLTKRAILQYTGGEEYRVGDITRKMANSGPDSAGISAPESAGYSLSSPWKPQQGSMNEPVMNSDILSELEECLAMEKALIEKLERMQSRGSR